MQLEKFVLSVAGVNKYISHSLIWNVQSILTVTAVTISKGKGIEVDPNTRARLHNKMWSVWNQVRIDTENIKCEANNRVFTAGTKSKERENWPAGLYPRLDEAVSKNIIQTKTLKATENTAVPMPILVRHCEFTPDFCCEVT